MVVPTNIDTKEDTEKTKQLDTNQNVFVTDLVCCPAWMKDQTLWVEAGADWQDQEHHRMWKWDWK